MNRDDADRTKRRLLAVLQRLAPDVGRKLWRRGVAKLDGWRALAYVDRGGTRLISRRGRRVPVVAGTRLLPASVDLR